ncbi:MAG: right-handed parallel beta-helix repeat-containing protein [Chloroflexi bacterium]|nr:right-handed parallel beta-helix repeat-containing protein [Chloroflexota bacterium]
MIRKAKLILGIFLLTLLTPPTIIADSYDARGNERIARASDAPIPLAACGEITSAGNYRVTANLKSQWDCLVIRASNVALDCDGRAIEGNNFEGAGVLVKATLARLENIEIKNCKISNQHYGIYVEAGKNIFAHNNDLSRNYDDTARTLFGKTMGWVDGGGLRMDRVDGGVIEKNIANENANGIDARQSERVIVRNNIAGWNTAAGIFFWDTSHSEIRGNTVNDNHRWCVLKGGEFDGWAVPGCDTAGILLQDGSSENLIAQNAVVGQNGDGIYIRADGMKCGDGNAILNNRVTGALWNAIEVGYCARTVIAGNEIANAKIGVYATFVDSVEIRDNAIRNVDQFGIALKNSAGALIARNDIRASPEGIFLSADARNRDWLWFLSQSGDAYRSYGNLVQENHLRDLTNGIHLRDSTANRLIANDFVNVQRNYWLEGDVSGNAIRTRDVFLKRELE